MIKKSTSELKIGDIVRFYPGASAQYDRYTGKTTYDTWIGQITHMEPRDDGSLLVKMGTPDRKAKVAPWAYTSGTGDGWVLGPNSAHEILDDEDLLPAE